MARYEIDPLTSRVKIAGSSSVHPITATATGLTGWLDIERGRDGSLRAATFAGEVRIAVDRLASGNPLVDRETRRRIDARKFPEIVGLVTAAVPIDRSGLDVTGDLTFRGETRSVRGEIDLAFDDGTVTVAGTQTFDVRNWGLRLPRIGLLRVHPDVRVDIAVTAHTAT
ncbi:MAG: YceI family protein [Acidimicrobiia bacterium]|nr:YceI family protein [Acidimicrobiia bacterium]